MGKKSPLRTIDNNAAFSIVNAAYKQAVGDSALDVLDLSDFCDSGVAAESWQASRDKFYKALFDKVVDFYADTTFEGEEDLYYVEDRRFANVMNVINAAAPDVTESLAWKDFSPNTSTNPPTYATVGGPYQVVPATVSSRMYQKTVSWQLTIPVTTQQLTDAFLNAEELRGFIDYLFVQVDNKLTEHRNNLSATNRNSFMAHKINAAKNGAPGIHVVNLLTKYNTERGGNISSVSGFLSDPEALRYAGAQIKLFSEYMQQQTSLFNTEGLVKFCPRDRLVLEVNSAFESAVEEVALSSTYHESMIALPGHRSTAQWQSTGITDATALIPTEALAFDQVSAIDVTTDALDDKSHNITIYQSGIVAFMADRYSCCHTRRGERIIAPYYEPEDVTLYMFQNRDMYANILSQNAVVFIIEPASPTPPVSQVGISGNTRSKK